MKKFSYQLSHWKSKESDLDSVIAPFIQYRQVDDYVLKHTDKGYAIFTMGDLLDKNYKGV